VVTIIGSGILAFLVFASIIYGTFYNLYWPLGFTILGFGLLLIWSSRKLIKFADDHSVERYID
jgi:hypothetical protein